MCPAWFRRPLTSREIQVLEHRLAELDPQGDEAVALRRKILDLRLDVSLRIEALAKRS